MPNARTHDFITVASAAVLAPAGLACSGLPGVGLLNVGVMVGSYLASGLLFSPDLDLHSTPYKRWRGLRWIWLPYQWMVPHRSWVSHSYVAGPLIRVAYFAIVITLLTLAVLALINFMTPVDPTGTLLNIATTIGQWLESNPVTVGYALVGLVLGGASHTVTDVVFSGIKRRIRRF
ncbi:MAG TPA: metal-binding protein [Chloroflexia bacterium]|nr:metal-binding protein [Chloroflexia bacterium]